jgi:hypothetical protein
MADSYHPCNTHFVVLEAPRKRNNFFPWWRTDVDGLPSHGWLDDFSGIPCGKLAYLHMRHARWKGVDHGNLAIWLYYLPDIDDVDGYIVVGLV